MLPCPRCGGTVRAELSKVVVTDPATGQKSTFLEVSHACPDGSVYPSGAEVIDITDTDG